MNEIINNSRYSIHIFDIKYSLHSHWNWNGDEKRNPHASIGVRRKFLNDILIVNNNNINEP